MFKRKLSADSCSMHARNLFEPRQQLLHKRFRLFRLLRRIALHFRGETLARIKAGVVLKYMRKAANEQARAGKQQHGEADLRYRTYLETRQLASGTINLRLGAVRSLVYEAADCGLLSSDLAAGIRRVKGVKKLGVRLGNWLTAEQSQELWQAPDNQRMKAKRDRALLDLLLASGLRRHEAVSLRLDHLQQREDQCAIADLLGKGGHIRTVPIPGWVIAELNEWLKAADIKRRRIFRKVNKTGHIWGDSMTEKAVWHVVKECAKRIGVAKLAPHDLRRKCAKLCQTSGGELEQIQFLLGHVSVQTTERYLGCKQRIRSAVNGPIGIEPKP